MAFPDAAKLRGLAGEKGYPLVRAPVRDCWFLVNDATEMVVSPKWSAKRDAMETKKPGGKPAGP